MRIILLNSKRIGKNRKKKQNRKSDSIVSPSDETCQSVNVFALLRGILFSFLYFSKTIFTVSYVLY